MSKLIAVLGALFVSPLAVLASVDQGLLALVPAETVVLSGVDATSARNSDFGQYVLRQMNTGDQNFQQMTDQTGFDPRRDLQDLLFVGFGPRQSQGQSRFAVLARGTFDQDRIGTAAQARATSSVQQYGGLTLYVNSGRHGGSTAFAFPDTGIAVIGDLATVQEIIDHRSNPSVLDPGLLDRVNNVGTKNDVWFASLLSGNAVGKLDTMAAGQQFNTSQALKSVIQSSGGILFGSVVKMSLEATTRSPQDAGSLADVIRFLSSMVQGQQQSTPQAAVLAKALSGMSLQTHGSNVHVSMSVPEQDLELMAQARANPAAK